MKFFHNKEGYVTIVITVAIVLAIIGVGWGVTYIADKYLQPINHNPKPSSNETSKVKIPSLEKIKSGITLKKSPEGRVDIMLLGISGEDYISGNLADTIMIADINTENSQADLFSIPRDLWISHDGQFQKINELYRVAGGTEVPNTEMDGIIKNKMEQITGRDIHYTVIINLEGIKQLVDIIGGVKTEEGLMNGEEALTYVRDRSRPGGDFDRMDRQQELIIAILNKLSSGEETGADGEENVAEKLFTELSGYIATDMTLINLLQLDLVADEIDLNDIGMHSITPETGLLYSDYTNVAGQQIYTLHPTAGYEDYSKIQEFISNTLKNNEQQ
ncbi:MAG: LCP family protein [Candidatus Spechtbacterales bacterium]|nr:LCP family protein [Candidatus Spechtbacterales bacterium]